MFIPHSFVPRRSGCCANCKVAFKPGSTYVSNVEAKGEKWIRLDFCESCVGKISNKNDKYFWYGKLEEKKVQKNIPKNEKAFTLLHELLESEDVISKKTCFLLSLYLVRKKQLHLREVKGLCIFTIPDTQEEFIQRRMTILPDEAAKILTELKIDGF
jgi:hypothetical protein